MEHKDKVICPFCGKDITQDFSILYSIPQEETAKRDFSLERSWTGSYIKETKYTRHFCVYCCKHCYDEYQRYDKWSGKYIMFAAPIGFFAGVFYSIYMLIINESTFHLGQIMGCILYGILGVFLLGVPNIFLYFMYGKRTSYKHASRCNAIRW